MARKSSVIQNPVFSEEVYVLDPGEPPPSPVPVDEEALRASQQELEDRLREPQQEPQPAEEPVHYVPLAQVRKYVRDTGLPVCHLMIASRQETEDSEGLTRIVAEMRKMLRCNGKEQEQDCQRNPQYPGNPRDIVLLAADGNISAIVYCSREYLEKKVLPRVLPRVAKSIGELPGVEEEPKPTPKKRTSIITYILQYVLEEPPPTLQGPHDTTVAPGLKGQLRKVYSPPTELGQEIDIKM